MDTSKNEISETCRSPVGGKAGRLCLVNCYSDDNKGDCGIIFATISGFKRAWGRRFGAELTSSIISVFGERDLYGDAHRFAARNVDALYPAPVSQRLVPEHGFFDNLRKMLGLTVSTALGGGRVLFFRLSGKSFRQILTAPQRGILNADLVISKGGSFLYSRSGIEGFFFLYRMFAPLIVAIFLGRKPIVLGQSVGPFQGFLSKRLARWVFRNCAEIYVRETFSENELRALGIDRGRIRLVPDVAFLLAKLSSPVLNDNICIQHVLGVTARTVSRNKQVQANFEKTISAVLERFLRQNQTWSVRFLPQVIGPSAEEDDRDVQDRICNLIDSSVRMRANTVTDDLDPYDLLRAYRQLSVLLSTRLHSSIFAATQGVPSVVLEYQQKKAEGTYAMMGMSEWVLPWQTSEEDIFKKLTQLIDVLPQQSAILVTKVQSNVSAIEDAIDYITNNIPNP